MADNLNDGRVVAIWKAFGNLQDIISEHRDYIKFGNDRGGVIDVEHKVMRMAPCPHPVSFFYVMYNGDIMPCCHINPDIPSMKSYIIGNIGNFSSIFDAYANSSLVEWRCALTSTGPKGLPCTWCTDDAVVSTATSLWANFRSLVGS